MYKAHFTGTATAKGFRGLGIDPRVMSPDALFLAAITEARKCGVSGLFQQKQLARLILENFNPVETPACDNVVDGTDVHLWGTVQVCQNGLRDLVVNGLNSEHFYRCDRSGNPVGDTRAWGYYVIPGDTDETIDIQDAWVLLNEEVNL
jgi:hypothetical protein